MTAPRLVIDLGKLHYNARTLVHHLAQHGIAVTGVTKATLGSVDIARIWLDAGVAGLGDSRLENLEGMSAAGVPAPLSLIRSPMLSQVERIVTLDCVSFNTELTVIRRLASAAREADLMHGVLLMVELGDLREGIMPDDLNSLVYETLQLPNIVLMGLGTNLACQSGVVPDVRKMEKLSNLANSIESTFALSLSTISGGNSANLAWALSGAETGRINDLRLGESLLLGRDPLHRQPIDGLHTDAITLVAEVIESKTKPSRPWGAIAQSAFGEKPRAEDRGPIAQVIVALGCQDTDPDGLEAPPGMQILGASSDHLMVDTGHTHVAVGDEITLQMNYSALVRAMTSPFIARELCGRVPAADVVLG